MSKARPTGRRRIFTHFVNTGKTEPLRPAAARLKAIIFDVDGTLYYQRSVRRSMLYRLLRAHLRHPAQGVSTLRALRAYRRAQEHLRTAQQDCDDIANAQLRLACEWSGIEPEEMSSYVKCWMERESLAPVASSLYQGVREFLQLAKGRGIRLGVFSDYPAEEKLSALGIAPFFDITVSAQDPQVQRFKPDPRGLEVILRRLGVEKDQALYVGDRPEVDAVTAFRAGVTPLIIGRKRKVRSGPAWINVSSYRELSELLFEEY